MIDETEGIDAWIDRIEIKPSSVWDWTSNFKLSEDEAQMIADPEYIVGDLRMFVGGHVIAWIGESNAGKTTIMMPIAGQMARAGYQVYYVNSDVSATDAKGMVFDAKEAGYHLLLPDFKEGLSMQSVINNLVQMNQQAGDYSKVVFIFDTLKKCTDVISKGSSKAFYKLLRGLSAKGMTSILLGHTNKYKGEDGMPIYEGTADLRSDVDELIYLIPKKNDDGSITVSTIADKVRAAIDDMTFTISADREVTRLNEYVDTKQQREEMEARSKDAPIIDAIQGAIGTQGATLTAITEHCKDSVGVGWRTVNRVLNAYKGEAWTLQRGFANNRNVYLPCDPTVTMVSDVSGNGGESG